MNNNFFDKIVDACIAFVFERYKLVLVIIAIITIPMIYGFFTQQHNNQIDVITSQIYSFILSFIAIFIMMYFVCKSIPLVFISMIPNIFPIFLTLGVMGIFDIPFDIVTIMIGGITIGIVVDDTTHFMIWFRRNMMKGMSHEDAIVQTFRDVGRPAFFNSFILFAGFFVLVLGSVWPTRMFGYLAAFTLLIAPFGDYFMLPSLLVLFKPKVKR